MISILGIPPSPRPEVSPLFQQSDKRKENEKYTDTLETER
jgi:hypothetical protein